ncbi:3-oxoacyl-(acyl-carrier-protein) reductase-like protein [Leptotrombidium deliense]|uniref:3-oxoacyl-(Acyl-carrier-protein) reductase-like protein n=1 Tax=Leptotrombidium deliense TaxID=299467 RepID=A0A443S4N7_9ACAR|nr:3-oxoacyl-(acyl-carrier-protein) reductase-like protein [Leptotrombidium deliense]
MITDIVKFLRPVDTPFYDKLGFSEEAVEKLKNALVEINPLRRIGDAIDIANLIVFLASENACYINGANYNIDGATIYENVPDLQ